MRDRGPVTEGELGEIQEGASEIHGDLSDAEAKANEDLAGFVEVSEAAEPAWDSAMEEDLVAGQEIGEDVENLSTQETEHLTAESETAEDEMLENAATLEARAAEVREAAGAIRPVGGFVAQGEGVKAALEKSGDTQGQAAGELTGTAKIRRDTNADATRTADAARAGIRKNLKR